MNIILVVGILLIIISVLQRKKLPPYWGFVFVFLIMGFQEGVEGDFMEFKAGYELFAMGHDGAERISADEPVWAFINTIFSLILPFWAFVILLSAFNCWVLYIFGRCYGSKNYGWIGPILFFFTFFLMLIQMKAMRQGLAVEMVVLALYVTNKKHGLWWTSGLVVFAYFIHNSTLIVVPLVAAYLWYSRKNNFYIANCSLKDKQNYFFPVLMTGLFVLVYYIKPPDLGLWLNTLASIGSGDMRLTGYLTKEDDYEFHTSILIIAYNAVIVFLSSWFMQRTSRQYKIFAIAAIIGCYGEMLFFGLTTLQRMFMFFYIFNIYTFPKITEMIYRKYGRMAAIVLIVFLVGYAVKTSWPWIMNTDSDRFGNYHFVFLP